MGKKTNISWTNSTFSPWWGCQKVSQGCANCYAEGVATRFGSNIWGPAATSNRRLFGQKHWDEPLHWNAQASKEGIRRRVFSASMADIFEDHPQVVAERAKLFDLIKQTPHLDWLLLTKRPENIASMLPLDWGTGYDNVWLGTSIEDESTKERVAKLVQIPAKIHFLSVEPMLGPFPDVPLSGINWIVCGGESGPKARKMSIEWARDLKNRCQKEAIVFFMKQLGTVLAKDLGRAGTGHLMEDFPEDLRLQNHP